MVLASAKKISLYGGIYVGVGGCLSKKVTVPIMENQMNKQMKHEMETGLCRSFKIFLEMPTMPLSLTRTMANGAMVSKAA